MRAVMSRCAAIRAVGRNRTQLDAIGYCRVHGLLQGRPIRGAINGVQLDAIRGAIRGAINGVQLDAIRSAIRGAINGVGFWGV